MRPSFITFRPYPNTHQTNAKSLGASVETTSRPRFAGTDIRAILSSKKILLVEDQLKWQETFKERLLNLGAKAENIRLVTKVKDAMEAFESEQPDLILLDHQLPGGVFGHEFAIWLYEKNFPANRIIMTGTYGFGPNLLELSESTPKSFYDNMPFYGKESDARGVTLAEFVQDAFPLQQ